MTLVTRGLLNNTDRQKNSFPVEIEGDSYSFDIADFEYDSQIILSPTKFKRERIKL
jgi:hypothetical protein